MSSTAPASGGRVVALDGVRSVAFLAVFVHHAFEVPLLWAGVDLFFVMSGFLITGILIESKKRASTSEYFKTFYWRRVLRILPPYYAVLAIAFLTVDRGLVHDWPWFAFFLSNVHDASTSKIASLTLAPMWSLAVEEQFYLVWPIVVLLVRRRAMIAVTVALIVLAPALRALVTFLDVGDLAAYKLMPCRIDLLAAGALLAVLWRSRREALVRRRSWALAVALAAGALFVALAVAVPTFRTGARSMLFNTAGFSLCTAIFASSILYVLTATPGDWLHRLLTARVPVLLGTISYGMYLVHQGVIYELGVSTGWPRALVAAGALAATFTVAWLSWTYYESPILRLKNLVGTRGAVALQRSRAENSSIIDPSP